MAKTTEANEKSAQQKQKDFEEAFYKSVGVKPADAEDKVRQMVGEALGKQNPSDDEVSAAMDKLHKSGSLDPFLRSVGLVPKPGIFSALTGWHDVEHLRSKGASNKIAGVTSLSCRIAVLAYGCWKGYEYFTR